MNEKFISCFKITTKLSHPTILKPAKQNSCDKIITDKLNELYNKMNESQSQVPKVMIACYDSKEGDLY